jgi:hypothetical protein
MIEISLGTEIVMPYTVSTIAVLHSKFPLDVLKSIKPYKQNSANSHCKNLDQRAQTSATT